MTMDNRKLPDAEFEIMKAIWQMEEPVTSSQLTERLRTTLPIPQDDYLQIEAASFRRRFSGGRFTGLVKALCDTDDLTEADIADLQR